MPVATIGNHLCPLVSLKADPKAETMPAGELTPYTQLRGIVASYGYGAFNGDTYGHFPGDTGAKRAIYAAALEEHRDRPDAFTDHDLRRVMDAAARA
jgi:hypothetical protein